MPSLLRALSCLAIPIAVAACHPMGLLRSSASTSRADDFVATSDDGMTSDTHAAYVGQIVFASAPIDKEHPDALAFTSELYADEFIYGRVFAPHSVANHPLYQGDDDRARQSSVPEYFLKAFLDGTAITPPEGAVKVKHERRAATTMQVYVRPRPGDGVTSTAWVEAVSSLTPGAHELRLEVWTRQGELVSREPLAAGTLTIHKVASEGARIGRSFADFEAGMTDDATSVELLAATRVWLRSVDGKETPTHATIASKDWEYAYDKGVRGKMTKQLQAYVRSEWPDGHCSVQLLTFRQRVDGKGGRTGEIRWVGQGVVEAIDCTAAPTTSVDHWAGTTQRRPTPTGAAPAAVAIADEPEASASTAVVAHVERPPSPRRVRFELGGGVAANALVTDGLAGYGSLGAQVGRVQLGVGATWPLNALGYLRFALTTGRFEVAPVLQASVLAEPDTMTETAFGGGLALGYAVVTGPISAGFRVEALVSYNPAPGSFALPVLGSTWVRF